MKPSAESTKTRPARGRTQALGERRRRDRLSALDAAVDESARLERRKALRALLSNPLISSETGRNELFSSVRKHADWLRNWFAHYAGWSLHVTAEVARLNKTPANVADATRSCRDLRAGTPFSRRRYVLLCLALSFLERAQRQTTLGQLAEGVLGQVHGNALFQERGIVFSLEHAEERRDFVQVLRKLIEWRVIERVQGEEERFVHDRDTDVLYNVHHAVLGRLLAARQGPSLLRESPSEERLAALVAEPLAMSDEGRNRQIRLKLFRRLLDDPVLYFDELDDEERVYWDRQRAFIIREITAVTGLVAELRREGIAMVDPMGELSDWGLPEEGTEGHLTLLIAEYLAARLRSGDAAEVHLSDLCAHTRNLIEEHRNHWRKSVREPSMENTLTRLVLERLEGLHLLWREGEVVIPLPPIARFGLRGVREA